MAPSLPWLRSVLVIHHSLFFSRHFSSLLPATASTSAAFQWDDFAAKNNAELNDNLGNFINRTLKFIWAR
jgi:hypothetical protein